MVDIYISLDENKFISGYGHAEYGPITSNPKNSILVELDNDHEILSGDINSWRLVNGKLTKDNTKVIEEAKGTKKSELSQECTNSILSGFTATVDKKEYTFSYDKEAQANLAERWQLFQNEMIDSIVLTARTLEDNTHTRIKVTKAEFTLIYLSSVKHKEDNISRLHDLLVPLVNKAVSVKQVQDIHWTNEMIYPNEPSIIVKDDKTLDKNIGKVDMKADMVSQANQLTSMAMMEIANFVFVNGASAK